RMHMLRHGSKRSLGAFIKEKMEELALSLEMGSQLQNKDLGKHVISAIRSSADPDVEHYTRDVGVHNIIEMALFLRLLGKQSVQITLMSDGLPITSWILNTTSDGVDNIQVIPGKSPQNTINLDVELDDFRFEEDQEMNIIDYIRILTKMITSNKGIKKRLNFGRILLAGASAFR
ncbi:MAG: hypothetical protein MIO87_02925, partial [Methanomassiliicoccales archaeon]|nr:hypothetical protein [Methanomassiliicoccales archaeon]